MTRKHVLWGLAASAVVTSAAAYAAGSEEWAPAKTFAEYEQRHEFVCNGPIERLASVDARDHAGYRYEHSGFTAKVVRTPASGTSPASAKAKRKGPVRIGVLSAIKDAEPETFALLEGFLADFEKRDVDFIVVGGDTGDEPAILEKVYEWLGSKTKRPVLTVPGNSERPAAHNYAVAKARKAGHPQLINMTLVRRVDFDGVDVVSLGGYFNKAFLHMRGACVYKPEDVEAMLEAAKQSDDPVVLLMHGPPKQDGKDAIDFVPGDGNVGDPAITEAIKTAKIPFGVFGHILEAGARATDLAGKPLKPGKAYPALYLNPGSANPLPWKLNSGGTSYGLAAVLTVEGKKAKYEVLRAPKPVAQAAE